MGIKTLQSKKAVIILGVVNVVLVAALLFVVINARDRTETPITDNQSLETMLVDEGGDDNQPTQPDNPELDDEYVASYIGLSEDEAIDRTELEEMEYRIVARDGEQFPVTMDFNPERLNFTIEDGRVAQAELY